MNISPPQEVGFLGKQQKEAFSNLCTEPPTIIGLVLTGRIPVQRNEGTVENLRITKAETLDRPALADTGLHGEVQLGQTAC